MARLSAANAALRAANDELAGFAYAAAHDLRAPLRTIDGFARILIEDHADKLDREGRRLLDAVRDGALKMRRLIDDILALCHIGGREITIAPVDMAALVVEVLAEPAISAADGRQIVFDIKRLPGARGDRRLLQHVWFNLLENAIKFTSPKPVARIEIGGIEGEGEVVYYVRDNGIGFERQRAGRLFVPFQRLHDGKSSGSGIGLAIVKRILDRHGGRVWAEGQPGEGAEFSFALPS